MKRFFLAAFVAATTLLVNAQYPYKVIAPLNGIDDGSWAFLTDYDSGATIDSVVVADHAAVFQGELDEPFIARITANGKRQATFILEQGTTAINQTSRRGVGSMLNDQYNLYADSIAALEEKVSKIEDKAEREKAYSEIVGYITEQIQDNMDSPIGFYLFMDYAFMVEPDEWVAFLEKNPDLKSYTRVQNLIKANEKKQATSPGKMFTDFEVEYNGTTKKLSDYVGKGHYTLVDFWASWCGPCIREIRTLKEINEKYGDKGLEIVGFAVWDEPQNTEAAIKRLNIPWECVINCQTIPTDAYGISGIPCIILFGPDGTIISRDKQGIDLVQAVEEALK